MHFIQHCLSQPWHGRGVRRGRRISFCRILPADTTVRERFGGHELGHCDTLVCSSLFAGTATTVREDCDVLRHDALTPATYFAAGLGSLSMHGRRRALNTPRSKTRSRHRNGGTVCAIGRRNFFVFTKRVLVRCLERVFDLRIFHRIPATRRKRFQSDIL